MGVLACLLLSLASLVAPCRGVTRYTPDWSSLDTRPVPPWYDEAKFGIFLHWGVFSVPSFWGACLWYCWEFQKVPECVEFMKDNYRPGFSYQEFASQFTAEFFDPDRWADIFHR
ncbi:hypothetical protein HPB48_026990 [Haemaphysalis longicornis]|uniref:alpha-L-fucosidase n=1 Tax=Haemaphysalis longicornis TaxID=44386 RepID=A0A9J6HB34_HAELO|nr:hypothetical protein HPB48_026990 [Haemaphysalis longicornis]